MKSKIINPEERVIRILHTVGWYALLFMAFIGLFIGVFFLLYEVKCALGFNICECHLKDIVP